MILPPLEIRDVHATEEMDDPGCDPQRLERTYASFRTVNALVAGWRTTYLHVLRPHLRRNGVNTMLDVGCGGGDITRALARWGRADGFAVSVTGIDPDRRAHAWATSRPPVDGVRFRRVHTEDLVAEGAEFDLVVSNHLLHHLNAEQLTGLLQDSERLTKRAAVHSDIQRGRLAYSLFSAGTWPFFRDSFIREDGLTSIRRSYTASELREHARPHWVVRTRGAFRLLLTLDQRRLSEQ